VTCIKYKIAASQKISHLPSSNSNLSLLLETDARPFTAELVWDWFLPPYVNSTSYSLIDRCRNLHLAPRRHSPFRKSLHTGTSPGRDTSGAMPRTPHTYSTNDKQELLQITYILEKSFMWLFQYKQSKFQESRNSA
jgi:hypothetical protein